MPTFEPPTQDVVPPIYIERDRYFPVSALSQRLFRHYKSRARGRQAYILTDGTVTETQPYNNEGVQTIVYGGHVNVVTEAELIALEAYFGGGAETGGLWSDLSGLTWGALKLRTWARVTG